MSTNTLSSPQIACITGASSGIGRSCALELAAHGYAILAIGRRTELLTELCRTIEASHRVAAFPLTLDVRNRNEVQKAFAALPETFRTIDVLINNAGLAAGLESFPEASLDDLDQMIDTNLKGLLYVTHTVVPQMVRRGSGDIVLIGSISGHEVYPKGAVYCATKHAVVAFAKGLKMDLHGTGLRVICIDPGIVETEFSLVRFKGDNQRAASVYGDTTPLTANDVADAVGYAISRPRHVNVADMVLLPTVQSSASMVQRR